MFETLRISYSKRREIWKAYNLDNVTFNVGGKMEELITERRFLENRFMACWKKMFGIFNISFCFVLLLLQMFILSIPCALDKSHARSKWKLICKWEINEN